MKKSDTAIILKAFKKLAKDDEFFKYANEFDPKLIKTKNDLDPKNIVEILLYLDKTAANNIKKKFNISLVDFEQYSYYTIQIGKRFFELRIYNPIYSCQDGICWDASREVFAKRIVIYE